MATRYAEDNDRSPLTWWNGHPIYATTLLVIVHVLGMVLFSLMMGAQLAWLISALAFSSEAVLQQAKIWQIGTYAFMNGPSLHFVFDLVFFFIFGSQLELFFGRRAFLRLYGILLLAAPALLLVVGAFTPTGFMGSSALHLSILVAFATLQPSVAIIWGVPMKWIAIIVLAIETLQGIAYHLFIPLLVLWASSALAYALVRFEQGRWSLPSLAFFQHKPKLHVVEKPKTIKKSSKPKSATEDASQVIDRLLDKITASGIQSLSEAERSQLENARQELLKRDR